MVGRVDEVPQSLWIALGVLGGLQVLTLFALIRLSGRVKRLSRMVPGDTGLTAQTASDLAEQKARTADQKHWFAEFLAEDETRKELPKKEQFEAFRRWRSERGLNWK